MPNIIPREDIGGTLAKAKLRIMQLVLSLQMRCLVEVRIKIQVQ